LEEGNNFLGTFTGKVAKKSHGMSKIKYIPVKIKVCIIKVEVSMY